MGGDARGARKPKCEASRYQSHHQITRCDPLRNQWLHVSPTQHSINEFGMAFAHLWIA